MTLKMPTKLRGVGQTVEIFRGLTLNNGAPNIFTTQIPISNPIVALYIRVNHALTVGTGTGAISEGELLKTKAITFQTDRGEYPLKNVPGRALYRANQIELGSAGQKDAVAASNGTYSVLYVLPFVNMNAQASGKMQRPFDTIFDPKRYKSVTLTITEGTIADLLTSVGTATVASTVDLVAEYLENDLPAEAKPIFTREIGLVQPANPASQTYIDFERGQDLIYTAFLVGTDNSATLGTPFSGTPTGNVVTDFSLETNKDFHFRTVLADVISRMNKPKIAESAFPTGRYYFDVLKDDSYASGLFSGELSKLRLTWNNGTLSSSQVSVIYDAVRKLKAA